MNYDKIRTPEDKKVMIKLYFIRWYEGQFNEYERKVTQSYGNY